MLQVFGPLLAGVRMVALAPDVARSPAALAAALSQHAVTHFVGIPSLLAALALHLQVSPGAPGNLSSQRVHELVCHRRAVSWHICWGYFSIGSSISKHGFRFIQLIHQPSRPP